jgi:hypothetical protein
MAKMRGALVRHGVDAKLVTTPAPPCCSPHSKPGLPYAGLRRKIVFSRALLTCTQNANVSAIGHLPISRQAIIQQ